MLIDSGNLLIDCYFLMYVKFMDLNVELVILVGVVEMSYFDYLVMNVWLGDVIMNIVKVLF